MLDPQEKVVFDDMVMRLGEDDPDFVRRVNRLIRPRHQFRTALAILLWTIAPLCIVYGGGTGLIMAIVAVAYGAHLMAAHNRMAGESAQSSSAHRRPRSSFS